MRLGYNTNGFAHHALEDAVSIIADIGYTSVALTLDHGALNPFETTLASQISKVRRQLEGRGLRSVVETGARFLLDPRQKHEPTLMSEDAADRSRRVLFLQHAIEIALELGSDCVSLWSGAIREPELPEEIAFGRLCQGLQQVIEYAVKRKVVLGFEPEPGMFIDSMARFERLLEMFDSEYFRLTLDIGHLHCQGETPIADQIRRFGVNLANVHLEDMKQGVHEHLMFGEGEIEFAAVIEALKDTRYEGGIHVELSRHSHMAPNAARRAYNFLEPLIK